MNDLDFQTTIVSDVHVHISTRPFDKSVQLRLTVQVPLDTCNIAAARVLPFVLLQGTRSLPCYEAIVDQFDLYYGAEVTVNSRKAGRFLLLEFHVQAIHQRYIATDMEIWERCLSLLLDIWFDPAVEDQFLWAEAVESTKEFLLMNGEETIGHSASLREEEDFLAYIMSGHPSGISIVVNPEQIERMTKEELTGCYRELLQCAQLHVSISGAIFPAEAIGVVQAKRASLQQPMQQKSENEASYVPYSDARPYLEEITLHVADQKNAKVFFALHFGDLCHGDAYPALYLLYHAFVALPFSRLYQEVRHKRSWVYRLKSRIYTGLGYLVVMTDLCDCYQQEYVDIAQKEWQRFQEELIDEKELESLKRAVRNMLLRDIDREEDCFRGYLMHVMHGMPWTLSSLCQSLVDVSAELIREVAQRVKWDTVYRVMSATETQAEEEGGRKHVIS